MVTMSNLALGAVTGYSYISILIDSVDALAVLAIVGGRLGVLAAAELYELDGLGIGLIVLVLECPFESRGDRGGGGDSIVSSGVEDDVAAGWTELILVSERSGILAEHISTVGVDYTGVDDVDLDSRVGESGLELLFPQIPDGGHVLQIAMLVDELSVVIVGDSRSIE